jgi:hypothetical protein
MNIFTSKGDQLTVTMDPVIRLDNGIEIWFGKKGETVEIPSVVWAYAVAPAIDRLQKLEKTE